MRLNEYYLSDRSNFDSLLDKSDGNQQFLEDQRAIGQLIKDQSVLNLTQTKKSFSIFSYYERLQLIRPQNYFLIGWYFLIIIIILYYIIEIGLLIAFGQIVWKDQIQHLLILHIFFYLVLVIDMFISPLKMFYSSGILVKDRKIISKQYFRFNFWIDLVALVSIIIPFFFTAYFQINIMKAMFFVKFYTVHQINIHIQKILIFHNKLTTLFLVTRLVVFLVLCAHCIGVGFYFIDKWIYTNNYYGPNTPNICWIYNSEAIYQMILVYDWPSQYVYVLYFSIGMTNTIAYGDITPVNPIETLYITFALIFNTLAFGYILAQALRILLQAFYSQFTYQQMQNTAVNILKRKRISSKLSSRIRCHLQEVFDVQMYRNRKIQKMIIDDLPFKMKYHLYLQIHKYFIYKLFSINQFSKFLERIVDSIHQERFISGNIVYNQNQKYSPQINNHKVYFIKEQEKDMEIVLGVGKLPILKFDHFGDPIWTEAIQIYKPKQLFGHVQFFTGRTRSHWALSKSNILLYHLSRKNFEQSLKFANKEELQNIHLVTQQVQSQVCFICQKSHNFKICQLATYQPHPLKIINKKDQRFKMKRKNSVWIKQKRINLKQSSQKYNALKGFKTLKQQISVNSSFKSKLKMFLTSKEYQKHYLQGLSSSSQSQSDGSSQDLQTMIEQTKILIQNYSKLYNQQKKLQQQLYWSQFQATHKWTYYKKEQNFDKQIERFDLYLQKGRMHKQKDKQHKKQR